MWQNHGGISANDMTSYSAADAYSFGSLLELSSD